MYMPNPRRHRHRGLRGRTEGGWLPQRVARREGAISKFGLVELRAEGVSYYSRHDEDCFFHWLGRMECVTKFYGRGKVLLIVVDRASVTRVELMELLGFFHRYGLDMKQLREFDWSEFSDWFRDENAYWHDRVFA